jgi:hypothetical protein
MHATVIPLRPKPARYSAAIAAEGWMEVAEAARRLMAFAEAELAESWAKGDVTRLRRLQVNHRDALTILAQGRKHAGWADGCADGIAEPGHGVAA